MLSLSEKKAVTETLSRSIDGRVYFMVGVSDKNLDNTYDLAEFAEEKGADALVITPTYVGNIPVLDYVNKISHSTSADLILYINPGISRKRIISIADMNELIKNERIKGVKVSSDDLNYFMKILALKKQRPDFKVFLGSEEVMIQPTILGDYDGIVSGTSNFAPKLILKIYESIKIGRPDLARDEINRLRMIHTLYEDGDAIGTIKSRVLELNLAEIYKRTVGITV